MSHPRKSVTIYDIPELDNEAQMAAFTPRNVLSGFKHTGIYPFNRNLFTEIDFRPLETDERENLPTAPQTSQSTGTASMGDLASIMRKGRHFLITNANSFH